MSCSVIDGELHYHNIARISNQAFRHIDEQFLTALSRITAIDDVRTIIFYKERYNIMNWPVGMYFAAIIKID